MTITTVHRAGGTDSYSLNFDTILPPGVALADHEVTVTGVTRLEHGRDGNKVSAVVSGGIAGTRAQILMTGITDETPPRRHPVAICLQVSVTCATEIDTP